MKRLTAVLLVLLLAGATGAEAWPWSKKKKLPDPIDSPIVRPKNKSAVKAQTQKHRSIHTQHDWGRDDRVQETKHPREGNHSIFQD